MSAPSFSVARLAGRLRWVVPVSVAILMATLLVPGRGYAGDPEPPPGATKQPPAQVAAAAKPNGPASTADSQTKPGPGLAEKPAPAVAPLTTDPKTWRPTNDRPANATNSAGAGAGKGYQDGVSKEDLSARTAYSAEFVNPDGSRTRRVYQDPAYVPDAKGVMQPIDATLRQAPDRRWAPAASWTKATFAPSAGAADVARLDLGDGVSLGFGVDGAAPVQPAIQGEVARYRGVRPNSDLELSAISAGVKERIVLQSAAAPASWLFPLRTLGATPVWDEASKSVRFLDRRGNIAAVIPPGFMADSSFDQRSGGPASSPGVTYALVPQGSGWALKVDLDQAWLNDSARVWPVILDPTISQFEINTDDTYVSSRDWRWNNNSAQDELKVGTYDWGGEVSQTYMHFNNPMSQLFGKYVTGATMYLLNTWSYSCTETPVSLHAVTEGWDGGSTYWPGPGFEETALDVQPVAHGYYGCDDWGWVGWHIPVERMNAWATGQAPFYGFTLQSSYWDALGWKKFLSSNYGGPNAQPFLSIDYVIQPPQVLAISPSPNTSVDTLTPTLWSRAADLNTTNLQYNYKICATQALTGCNESGWSPSPTFVPPSSFITGWSREQWWQVNVDNGSTQTGWLGPWMFTPVLPQPGVTSHLAGASEESEVPGVNPQVGNYATTVTDATVPVAGPALSVTRSYNSQDPRTNGAFGPGWSTPWDQRVDPDNDGSGNVVVTLASGLQVRFGQNQDGTYAPPPGKNLDLINDTGSGTWILRDTSGRRSVFSAFSGRLLSVTDADGRMQQMSFASSTPGSNLALNKTATGSASCNANELPAKAVNGSSSDKWCSAAAPRWLQVDLGTAQTVSSVVLKHAGAGGEATNLNTRDFNIQVSADGTTWQQVAVVTGNTDSVTSHVFSPTTARYVKLTVTTPTQTSDQSARVYEFEVYGGGQAGAGPSTVTDLASGRTLRAAWSNGRVTSVTTDAPATGQAPLVWTYSYSGGRLASVCSPLSASSCTSYQYNATSNYYRALVQDAGPAGYWPLGETSGTTATNIAARTLGQDGVYGNLTLGVNGVLAGSPDKAAMFAGSSQVYLPQSMVSSSQMLTVEEWFQAQPGTYGTLFGEQNTSGNSFAPMIYVGVDGVLRGMAPVVANAGPIVLSGGGLCMEPNGGAANGTEIYTAGCSGSWTQQWRSYPDGTLRIFGKCLDIPGYNTAWMTHLQLWDCHGDWNQVWQPTGWGGLYNPGSNTCLDFDGSTAGVPVVIYGCEAYWAQFWGIPAVTGPMTGPAVTDGQWHHVALTAGAAGQTLYLDGNAVGTITGPMIDHRDLNDAFIGNGRANSGFPGGPGGVGVFGFSGQIDEVAFYRRALAESEVDEHFAARAASNRLTTVIEPGPFTSASISYSNTTGRVTSLVDRNGATWTVGDSVVASDRRTVHIGSNASPARSIDYTYDTQHNGRVVSRAEAGSGTRAWAYNDFGFVEQATDENANTTTYTTDERGNVTALKTCRAAEDCQTQYIGYYLNDDDKLDPRNDAQLWTADARSANKDDPTYRITRTIDGSGRPLTITYPPPSGQTNAPVDTFTYTTGPYAQTTQARAFIPADQTVLALTGDDASQSITLPFPVSFYGTSYPSVYVSTNGFLTFDEAGSTTFLNSDIASQSAPNKAIYPFWDDLIVDSASGGSVRTAVTGTAPNRTFVVEWRSATGYFVTGTVSVEAVFKESGEISFNYAGIDGGWENGSTATVGLENATGTSAYRYSYNHGTLSNGTAIVFTPQAGYTGVPAGLPLTRTARNGGGTTFTYNAAGDLLTTTDPVGLVTTNTYDNLGRVATTKQSSTVGGPVDYGTTTITYNGLGQPATVTGPGVLNPVTAVTHTTRATYSYDALGRRTSQAVADTTGGDATRTTAWQYDPAGRLTKTTNPDGSHTDQVWNTAGDVVQTTAPGGLVLTYTYDYGHRVTGTYQQGDPDALETRSYDGTGRLVAVVDAVHRTTRYGYYGDNLPMDTRLVRVVGQNGQQDQTVTAESRTYDPAGHVVVLTTPGPNTAGATVATTYTYDAAGNVVTQAFDPTGLNRVTTNSYNLDGSVAWRTATGAASPGRTEKVSYTYDLADQVLTASTVNVATSAALTTTYVRDPRGLVTRETDPTNIATNYAYDLTGQLLTVTGAVRTVWVNGSSSSTSPVITLGRNTFGEVTQQRDPNSQVTTTAYDVMGRATSTTLPSYTPPGGTAITSTSSTTYNTQGLPATTTDGLGNVTSYAYDAFGRETSRTEPDPDGTGSKTAPVWQQTYYRDGSPLRATDPVGALTEYTYDTLGRQITEAVSEGGGTYWWTTNLAYDDAAHLVSATSPAPHSYVTTTTYNTAGEPTKVTDHTGRFTETKYDLAGRAVSTVDGQGTLYANPVSTATWDFAGRATSTSDCTATAAGACNTTLRTVNSTFDNAGRVLTSTSAQGRPTTYGYDAAGQLTSVAQRVDPAVAGTAITVSVGYDAAGNKTRMVDGRGNATIYTYNTWDLPESVIEPSTTAHPNATDRTWTTKYNAGGLATQQVLPGGVTRTDTYDKLGRLTGETATGATTTARVLDYDKVGRITSANSPAGNLTFTWTDRGLLASAAGYGGTTNYTYDGEARLTQRVDPAGTATFTYDGAGRLATAVDPLTGTTGTYTYDTGGNLSTITRGASSASRAYTYDNLGRVATDAMKRPNGTTSESVSYSYDYDDLLTSKTTVGTTGAGLNNYVYDGLDRVTSWTAPGGATTTYGYDAASNRTTVTTSAGPRTSTFDARNRITQTTGAGGSTDTYTWNPRGQLTGSVRASKTYSYTYDGFERLTQVTGTSLTTSTYTYDSLDRVAQRNTAKFGYNDTSNNPVLSPAAAGETKLLRDPLGTLLASKTGTSASVLNVDDPVHGDITASVNPSTGDPTVTASYDPWGTATSTGALPLGYQGGYTDPTFGMTNAQARWYLPAMAGFTSRDTWTLPPVPLAQANRYLYANGSPLTGRDPSGHVVENGGGSGGGSSTPVVAGMGCAYTGDCQSSGHASQDTWVEIRAGGSGEIVGMGGSRTGDNQPDGRPSPLTAAERRYAWNEYVQSVTDAGHAYAAEQERVAQCEASFWCRNAQIVGTVVGVVVGAIATSVCLAATAGAGSIGCLAAGGFIGGFVGSLTTSGLDGKDDSFGSVMGHALIDGAIGAIGGALGGAIGAKLASTLLKPAAGVLMRTLVGAAGGAASGAASGAVTGGAFAAVNYLNNCGSNCSFSGGLAATAAGAGEGALMGAAMGAVGGAFGGAFGGRGKPAVGCGNSFDEDTPVAMADGTTEPIRDVQPGDQVTATDPETGLTAARLVTATHINHDDDLVDVTVAATVGAAAATAVIQTTAHHLFWDDTTDTWTPAGELPVGHELGTDDGRIATVTAVASRPGTQDMYDLTVDTVHSFYVVAGSAPVLVHNCDTVVLGLNNPGKGVGSDELAAMLRKQGVDARTYNGRSQGLGQIDPASGQPVWMGKVTAALGNPNRRIAVALDGLDGANPTDMFRTAMRRGQSIGAHNIEDNGTNWEMSRLSRALMEGRSRSSVTFYLDGARKRLRLPTTEAGWKAFKGLS